MPGSHRVDLPATPLSIVHFTVPKGEYTSVQVEALRGDAWVSIGAEPVVGPYVAAQCHLEPPDSELRCVWVTPQGGQVRTLHSPDGVVARGRGRRG